MLNLERAGAILSLFIPAVWQEHAKSSSPFSQILWDACDNGIMIFGLGLALLIWFSVQFHKKRLL
jgi:hypothetical protein